MSEIHAAAEKAKAFAGEVYGEQVVNGARIEEVERHSNEWWITLSWATAMKDVFGLPVLQRVYKQFVVDDGVVKAMRVRIVE